MLPGASPLHPTGRPHHPLTVAGSPLPHVSWSPSAGQYLVAGSGRRFSGRRPPWSVGINRKLAEVQAQGPATLLRGPLKAPDAARTGLMRAVHASRSQLRRPSPWWRAPPLPVGAQRVETPTASSARALLSGPHPWTSLLLLQFVNGRFSWGTVPPTPPNTHLHCSLMVGSPGSEFYLRANVFPTAPGIGFWPLSAKWGWALQLSG